MSEARRVANEGRDFVSKLVTEIMLNVEFGLTSPPSRGGTPRETGFHASNWVGSIREPFTEVVGSPEAVSFAAQQRGRAELNRFDMKRDRRAYLSNNAPNIVKLNDGDSTQAPKGFVQKNIVRGIRKLQNVPLAGL